MVIKTAWYLHKSREIDQWNRIKSPEINQCLYWQLIYGKGGKNPQLENDILFNKWYWENWKNTCKKNETTIPSYTRYKNKSKWVRDLNVRFKTIKLLEENIVKSLTFLLVIFLLIYILRQEKQKKKINRWDYLKLKSFCRAKETINKMKRQPTKW